MDHTNQINRMSDVILYVHGGTFFAGNIESHRPLAANIAVAARTRALIIDYRLSPEHPYPAGLEDADQRLITGCVKKLLAKDIAIASDSGRRCTDAGFTTGTCTMIDESLASLCCLPCHRRLT